MIRSKALANWTKLTITGLAIILAGISANPTVADDRSAIAELESLIKARRAAAMDQPRSHSKGVTKTPETLPETAPEAVFYPNYADTVEQSLELPDERQAGAGRAALKAAGGWTPVGSGIVENSTATRHGMDRTGRASSFRWAHDHQQDGLTMYLGSLGGGLWKWILGSHWTPLSWTLDGAPSVGAFWVDPDDSRRIILGTGEVRNGGTGVYLTEDEGLSWLRLDLDGAAPTVVFAIEADESNPDLMMMATLDGLLRSDDRGLTWRQLATGNFTDLVQRPDDPSRWLTARGRLTNPYNPGEDYGVAEYDSNSDSLTFMGAIPGPANTINRISLTWCRDVPDYVYALITQGGDSRGIYRSDDGGASWTTISTRAIGWGQAGHTSAITVSPVDPDILFVGVGGFEWTDNATASSVTWIDRYAVGHDDYTSATMDPEGKYLVVTNDGGLYGVALADLQSVSWEHISPYIADSFNTTGGLNLQQVFGARGNMDAESYLALAGLQDNGHVAIERPGSGQVTLISGGDGGHIHIAEPGVYSGSVGLPFSRVWTTDGGASWSDVDCQYNPSSQPYTITADYNGLRLLFTHDGTNLYFRDPSQNCASEPWRRLNRKSLPAPAVQMEVADDGSGELVFYMTDGWGSLWVLETQSSVPFGQLDWVDRTPPLPGRSGEKSVISPGKLWTNSDHVYVTTADRVPALAFASDDRGMTWREVTQTINQVMPNAALWELVADPRLAPDTFIVVTNVGVLRTDDGGLHWYRWMEGLPRIVDVPTIEVQSVDEGSGIYRLLIGTRGAGFFERTLDASVDDYAPTGTITSPTSGACHGLSVPLTVSVTDNVGIASVRYRIMDSSGQVVTQLFGGSAPDHRATWFTSSFPGDSASIDAVVSDANGNQTILQSVSGIRLERTPPTVTMLDPPDGFLSAPWITSTQSVLLRSQADDSFPGETGCGLAEVRFSARYRDEDGFLRDHPLGPGTAVSGTGDEYQLLWDVSAVPDQAKPAIPLELWVEAIAEDVAGNTAFTTAWLLGFDRQAPEVEIHAPLPGTTTSTQIPIDVACTDPTILGHWVARLQVRALYREAGASTATWHLLDDSQQTAGWQGTLDLVGLSDQSITIEAAASDLAGNSAVTSHSIVLDRTPPSLTFHGVTPNPFITDGTQDCDISFNLGDPALIMVSIFDAAGNAVELPPQSFGAGPATLHWNGTDKHGNPMPSGIYTCDIVAVDGAGNHTSDQDTFEMVMN